MSTTSPNMSLVIPTVGSTTGPDYALQTNQSLTLIDQHDHTPGKGVQISTAGININADFTFNGYSATNLKSLALTPQTAITALNSIYDVSGDLYFNDGVGNSIRITQSGGIAGTPGSISGLVAPASATYVPITQTFVFQSNTNIAGNLDAGSILLRNVTPNSTFALTLSPPAGLSSNFIQTLPTTPSSTSFMTMDNTGQMLTSQVYPLTAPGLQASSVITAKVQDGAITRPKLAAVGQIASSASGSFSISGTTIDTQVTNMSVTITTTGRPVILMLQAFDDNVSYIQLSVSTANPSMSGRLVFRRDSTDIATNGVFLNSSVVVTSQGSGSIASQGTNVGNGTANTGITAGANSGITVEAGNITVRQPISLLHMDMPAAGTYTYILRAGCQVAVGSSGTLTISNARLIAYELA